MASSGLPDYYGILEVEPFADEAGVKKAYRKLVLKWHPDKHPTDREEAEVKIRQINDAYETLSNPFKRLQYDQQLTAFERKAKGMTLNTAGIQPRMAIPKEFMLSPMGQPSKFVRCVSSSVFVHSRSDVKTIEFKDFFHAAKYSLWWLPEVNNMCRIRVQSSASDGYGGGVQFSFALSQQVNSSEITLSPSEVRESSALIAVASPLFQGCFRFESACFPGHYLAFKPPTHLRMVGGVVEANTMIDFSLVDYNQMFRFIMMEEVMMLAILNLGGAEGYVSLDTLRTESNMCLYFEKVVQRPVWNDEDFVTFFEGRSDEYDYDVSRRSVRVWSKQEQLANSLQRAPNGVEVAATISRATISKAGEELLTLLPLDTFQFILDALSLPPPVDAGASAAVNYMDALKKVFFALPRMCERKDVHFGQIIAFHTRVSKLGGEQSETKIRERRAEAARELGRIASQQVEKNGLGDQLTFEIFASLCEMSLDWKLCGDTLAESAKRLLPGRSLEVLLPPFRSVAATSASSLLEVFGSRIKLLLLDAEPQLSAEALEVMATAGLHLSELPTTLRHVQQRGVPFQAVASVVAALGERGVESDDLRAILAQAPPGSFDALPLAVLLRLMVASTKSSAVAEIALDSVAVAASVNLQAFNVDDTSKLLLAVAKAKGGSGGEGVASLYSRAVEVVAPRLHEFSVVQLIKIALAIGRVSVCKPLLEAAGVEALGRLPETSAAHCLLLVQGLLPLGSDHHVMEKVLDSLTAGFQNATHKENLLGADLVIDRRRELESQGQFTADNVAKLAQLLSPVVPSNHEFWEALGSRMAKMPKSLTSAGHASLEAAFPRGAGPRFKSKDKMLDLVAAAQKAKEHGGRDAVEMTTRERAMQRQKDYEKREAEQKQKYDQEHRADERERQREREKALERMGGGGGRRRSRSRSRSRDRRERNSDQDKKKRSRSRSRSRDRRERNSDQDKKKRSRSRSRDRDRDRGRDRDRDRDRDRGRDRDRDRRRS